MKQSVYLFKIEEEYLQWCCALKKFLHSVRRSSARTLADLRQDLQKKLMRATEGKGLNWIVTAYAALSTIIGEGILEVSTPVTFLESYLREVTEERTVVTH